MSSWRAHITLDPAKRGGKPCIRDLRITVQDVLSWLAAGMSIEDIVADYPELTPDDVRAALAWAAYRESTTEWPQGNAGNESTSEKPTKS